MSDSSGVVDPYLFDRQLDAFVRFVEDKSGMSFGSFAFNTYTEQQEGYKYEIYRDGRDALDFGNWATSDIGTGRIANSVLRAIELPTNNLVTWQSRYGDERRPHHAIHMAITNGQELKALEDSLFSLYRTENVEEAFEALVGLLGKKYSLLAYLFFLKDRSRYLPIAPTYFDSAFENLGVELRTSHQCSWQNYRSYIAVIAELQSMLSASLGIDVTLLDAHSFAWVLACQMPKSNALADNQDYLKLPATEREAIVKARIGQGRFRQSLIDYWSTCAVTGCADATLLRASHIKPWSKSSLEERLNCFNGLLLSPDLDACFDCGYASFTDDGGILISGTMDARDAAAIGIRSDMRLSRVDDKHKQFLGYHRQHIFKAS